MVLKNVGHAVGSIGLMIGGESHLDLPSSEGEIGYWIGVPYWGQGLIPEAANEIIRHAFEDLNLENYGVDIIMIMLNLKEFRKNAGLRIITPLKILSILNQRHPNRTHFLFVERRLQMKQFVKLQMSDLQKVVTFYNAIIDDSKESPYSPGWTKNIYPDKKLLSQLIAEKSMYGLKSFDKIFAAICLNNSCELESKKVNWNVNASENEVWFIHLLGVSKAEQGKGFGKN